MEEYHFVDDSSYTENYIHVNKSRKSPRQIVFELQQKGVDKDTISRMLEEAPINEDDTVRVLVKKKQADRSQRIGKKGRNWLLF